MSSSVTSLYSANRLPPVTKRPPISFGRLLIFYALIALIPYGLSLTEHMEPRGWYETILMMANIAGLSAMMIQFWLSSRFDTVTNITGIDHAMQVHRKAGEIIALFFFLHPFLIILPRLWIAHNLALRDVFLAFTSSPSATGVYAWSLMGIWVLTAMYHDKLRISYEVWRFTHGMGFIAIIILATNHAMTVGRHGRYDAWFDIMWFTLCSFAVGTVVFIYFVRPLLQKRRPFKLVSAEKVSASDWCLTIEKAKEFDFCFDAGQFVWINTSGNPFIRSEHPFSIASSPGTLPQISFIIRELGDFTSKLDQLTPGQKIYVDGPHGTFTLTGRRAKGLALIAGGAGIGPILGILRQLRDIEDRRPIRLIYGNRVIEQMVFQNEINSITDALNFEQRLILMNPPEGFTGYKGIMDRTFLEDQFSVKERESWDFYVCGPPLMVNAVSQTLKDIGIPANQLLYEQLAF